jgi:hypothetical protein
MHLTHHHNNMMTVLEASSSTTSWHHQPTMAASKSKQVKPSIPHVENKEEEQSLDGYKRGLFCDDRDMTCIMMFNIIYGLGVWVVGENAQEGFGVFIFGLPPVLEPDFDLLWLNVGQHRRLTDELLSSDGAGLGTLMIHPLQCLHLLVCVPHILPRGIHPTTSPLPFWSSPSSSYVQRGGARGGIWPLGLNIFFQQPKLVHPWVSTHLAFHVSELQLIMNASISYSTCNLNGHLGLLEQNYGLDFPLPVSCM